MANYTLRIRARELRAKGYSVKQIVSILRIAKSTASVWVRDVTLSQEIINKLKQQSLEGAERGRFKNILRWKEKRAKIVDDAKKAGIALLSNITDRELLVAGLSLYWGEGGKTNKRIEFCNSDPKMIKFLLYWLRSSFQVNTKDIVCTVGINEVHQKRNLLVQKYWSMITGIPLRQFNKTSFKKVINKKVYKNPNDHFGTLTVKVRKSTNIHYSLIGLIEGLYSNLPIVEK